MNELNLGLVSKTGIIALLVLLIGSFYFYQERVIFSDAAGIVYDIINKKGLNIVENRYGSFVTQMFPLFGTYFGLSLSAILILYSISFNLFYLASALYLHKIKQYSLSVTLAIYYTFGCSFAYYWTNNEIHQAVAWLAIFIGTAAYNENKNHNLLIKCTSFLFLCFIAIFTHPLIIFASVFLWGFIILEQKETLTKSKSFILYNLIIAIVLIAKVYLSQQGWYDGNKISNIKSVNITKILSALKSGTANDFLHNLIFKYWQMSLVTVYTLIFLIIRKNIKIALWTIACSILYFLSVCITYPEKTTHFYIESEWMSISILLTFPFVRYVIPTVNTRIIYILMTAIFILRLLQIYASAAPFTQRLNNVKQMVYNCQKQKTYKVIFINKNELLEEQLMMSWGLPIETFLISSLNQNTKPVTAIIMSEFDFQNRKIKSVGKKNIIEPFKISPSSTLNKDYFRFDTNQVYQTYKLNIHQK